MNVRIALGAALSLACLSAAEAPSNYQVYGGIRVDSDPVLLAVYDKALARCIPEATTPPRGAIEPRGLYYNAALRACLYRYGFFDRGSYAYPANTLFWW